MPPRSRPDGDEQRGCSHPGLHKGLGSAEGWDDAQSWVAWTLLPPALQLSSTCLSSTP